MSFLVFLKIYFSSRIKEPDLNLRDVLQKFTRINIDVEDQKVLININTLEEYRKLF